MASFAYDMNITLKDVLYSTSLPSSWYTIHPLSRQCSPQHTQNCEDVCNKTYRIEVQCSIVTIDPTSMYVQGVDSDAQLVKGTLKPNYVRVALYLMLLYKYTYLAN